MHQFSLRVSDELGDAVKDAAALRGLSVNAFVVTVLEAVTDPDHAGNEAAQLRERLARAGVLAAGGPPRQRPADHAAFARAGARAAGGRSTAEFIAEDRR